MAKYNLRNPYEQQKFKEKVNELYSNGECVELKKINPTRSLSQNSYLHVLLGFFASEFGYTIDEVKIDIFKRKCNKAIFERERMNKRGEMKKYLRSSANLDTKEMTTAIERFRNYSSSVCGLYLPSPYENEMLFFAQQQMDSMQEYI